MALIDVWLEKGRGVFGFVQRMQEPVFVVLLKNQANGEIVPVYEDSCEAVPGTYEVILYHAYDQDQFRTAGFLTVFPRDKIVRLVLLYAAGSLISSRKCADAKDDADERCMWNEYMQSRAGRIARPIGWNTSNAIKMINS